MAGDQPIVCGQHIDTPDGHRVVINDLRLFVHDIRLRDADGARAPLVLAEGPFQTSTLALLDFEDGCRNGTAATHRSLEGVSRVRRPRSLEMTLGVPTLQNHADPTRAEGPLSATSMHWTWKGGYKFLRLDYTRDGVPARVHLGSTGCAGTIGAPEGCRRGNRARVSAELPITLDVMALVESGGCMAGAAEPGCRAVFEALGLEPSTGASVASAPAFR